MWFDFSLSIDGVELPRFSELWMFAEKYIRENSSFDGTVFVKGKLSCTVNDYTLYTLNPETGAYTHLAKVTGISEGNTIFQCMAAIPESAS